LRLKIEALRPGQVLLQGTPDPLHGVPLQPVGAAATRPAPWRAAAGVVRCERHGYPSGGACSCRDQPRRRRRAGSAPRSETATPGQTARPWAEPPRRRCRAMRRGAGPALRVGPPGRQPAAPHRQPPHDFRPGCTHAPGGHAPMAWHAAAAPARAPERPEGPQGV
jgi:hypothetical protein